jgi:hypothetical protein
MFYVPENNDGLQQWGVALNCGGSQMNAFRINSQEDKSLNTSAAVIRSIAKTTVCLVIMVLAAAPSFAQTASVADTYIGVWRMFLNGKRVGTLQLLDYKGKLTGTVTNSHGSVGDGGTIQMYEAPGGSPIVESSLSGGDLHFVMAAPFNTTNDFKMTLNGSDKAHLTFYGTQGRSIEFDLKKISFDENDAVQVQY